jgi:hypothetical protein
MGAALLDATYRLKSAWIVGEGKDEFAALAALVGFLSAQLLKGIETTIVTWNGRGFDLPVIAARCLHHGLSWPWYFQKKDARYRYSAEGHFDVMDFLADHGAAKSYGLDVAAKLIGLPGKLDCTGGDVQGMIDAGQIEQVRAYCAQDVTQTTGIFLRTQLLRGVLAPAAYVEAMEVLLKKIKTTPRLAPLLPFIDRERLVPKAPVLVAA